MNKDKLQQIGVELLGYLTVLSVILMLPTRSWFINIVGLSFKVWVPFVVLFGIGVLYVFLKSAMANTKELAADFLAGLLIGLLVNVPLVLLVIEDLVRHGTSSEAFAIVFFTIPIFAISLFIAAAAGLLQGVIMGVYNRSDHKKQLSIVLAVIFFITISFFGKTIHGYNNDLFVGCPEFEFGLDTLALSSAGCIDQAAIKTQKGTEIHQVPELNLQFEYPKSWGKPNFDEDDEHISGKTFSMPFGVYYSLKELEEDGLVVGGATENFQQRPGYGYIAGWVSSYNEETCTFVRQSITDVTVSLGSGAGVCDGVEQIETPYGKIFYYHASASYHPVTDSQIRPNDGVALVPLAHSEYKVMLIIKRLDTPEKEEEFKKFLQSFKRLSQ